MRTPTKILVLGLVLLASVGTALAIAEVLVRVTGLASPPVAVTADERRWAENPGVFFPSAVRVDRRNPRLPHRVSINALGIRGAGIAVEKPRNERRVVVIGDSFTWGDYVDDEQTLPAQLERLLAASCPGTRVLNFGVGGTSIDAHVALLDRALGLSPDLVVLVFHDNDVTDLVPPTYWSALNENRARKSRFPGSLVYGVLRNTALWSVVRQWIVRVQSGRLVPPVVTGMPSAAPMPIDSTRLTESEEGAWPLDTLKRTYADGLRRFRDLARLAGLPLVIVAYPSHLALEDRTSTVYAWFEELVAAESLRYVDAGHALRATMLPRDSLYLFPFDAHASARGYGIVASALATVLLEPPVRSAACPAQ